MLPETWERVQFYRSMRRKLETPGSPWGHPTSIRTNGYMVQVLFPKRDPAASAVESFGSHGPIHMDTIEDVAPLQGRQVVGLDPGEIHIVANDTGSMITLEEYSGAKSMPWVSRRNHKRRDPEKPRRNRPIRPPVAADAIRQAAPPQSGGMQAVLAFATTHADVARVYCSPCRMRRQTHDARCEQVRDKRIGSILNKLAPACTARFHGGPRGQSQRKAGASRGQVHSGIQVDLPTATRPVILMNEFYTSKSVASECYSLMQSVGWSPSGKPLRETHCSNPACPRSKLENERDVNAAINIKLVSRQGRPRPAFLCRAP
jgi:hypothetical protein